MELALSLGDPSKRLSFLDKPQKLPSKDVAFCMSLGPAAADRRIASSDHPTLQLDLLPPSSAPRNSSHPLPFPWLAHKLGIEAGAGSSEGAVRGLDVNRAPGDGVAADEEEEAAAMSSPNSAMSSFQMDFGVRSKRCSEGEAERASSRASDDEENGSTWKKLRLSKDQSAFLEESFKEHSTLNPKHKVALAKQLNLRPRQVEVWFQNRRARTKLKQTEVDCEYLKRCCETLTEENRRLQKELQELRALKSSQPFYMQLPATTLTMCPSCERVATTNTTSTAAASKTAKLFPFPPPQPQGHHNHQAA